ncbi:M15 family metallopeptidase [Phaeobacter gallaeciensis]|uniref:M15 family metallopeptidase n=1 Tax=Phaeobacter gallaeciensis TaxID=60890 RepID=UPI00237FB5EE|nr:M15 family metallopeptidase [Phaeobacter gallaeciensis]MDE4059782.1 M15 family metallopeptidase [Phaeobacter gallaeciensis]MDE4122581.1 M15 family metallopeptidase [Phaeobacter gallaeciensis]MDE4127270.1 M15 family metallopeptidase [Phaeobacter gallaeciensis]
MYIDRLKNAQRVLRASAGYRGAIDGKVGSKTLASAWRVRGVDALEEILGPLAPDRRVVLAAQVILDGAGFDVGVLDGFWGPQTDAAFLAWRGEAMPFRQADMAEKFGPAGSARCTAGVVRVPWRMVLAWDGAEQITEFKCHELVAASAQRAFDRIAAAYSPVQIRDLGLHLYGGCFNYRTKRGGTSLSTHAYGLAIDFDPARNRLKWGADRARLAQRDATPFWQAWEAEGWTSLGRARNFDWMHVQAVAL